MSENNLPSEQQKTTSATFEKEKHFIKYVFWGLFALIIVLSIIALIKIRNLQEENIKQKVMYENKIDSIYISDMTTVVKTFSWAVRSDLLRNNKDQAQLHLENIIKEPHIKKAYIIDADKNTILLSTVKSEIGTPNANITLLNVEKTLVNKGDNHSALLICPMMDLNKKLGIVIVEVETK